MRYGVLADVHGNLDALEAALAALSSARVDAYLCLGDLVGYGPYPNECVRRIGELDAVTVAGNHDLIAVGRLSDEGCGQLARDSLQWTRAHLDAASRRFLERLPTAATLRAGIVLTHGALGDPRRYITDPDQAAQQLDRLRVEQPDAWLVLLGHTHVPMAVAERAGALRVRPDSALVLPPAERVLLNPGAVGQARQRRPYGSALVLDGEARVVTLRRFPCDTQAGRRALAARGLDAGSFHRPPSWRKRLKARARATRRTLRAARPRIAR